MSIKLELRQYKKAVKLKRYAYLCLHFKIRNLLKLKVKGHDFEKDELVFLIISTVLDLDFSEEDKLIRSQFEDELDEAIELIQGDQLSLSLIDVYAKLSNKINERLNRELTLETRILPITPLAEDIDLDKLDSLRKEIKNKCQSSIDQVYDRSTYKISFTYSAIGSILGIITPIIFLGGYFHSKIYFKHFGFNIHHYFSISDYITASIDSIESALTGTAFAIIGTIISVISYSRNLEYHTSPSTKKRKRNYDVVIMGLIIIPIIYSFYTNSPIKYFTLTPTIVVFLFSAANFLASKYFEDSLKALFLLSFVFQFFGNILVHTLYEIDTVEKNFKISESKVRFTEKSGLSKYEDLTVIGYSNSYVFLYDTLNDESITINKTNLLLIETRKK